jgi:hypothetical protein
MSGIPGPDSLSLVLLHRGKWRQILIKSTRAEIRGTALVKNFKKDVLGQPF